MLSRFLFFSYKNITHDKIILFDAALLSRAQMHQTFSSKWYLLFDEFFLSKLVQKARYGRVTLNEILNNHSLSQKLHFFKKYWGVNPPPPCGFSKNVSSKDRVKPWFFVTFNNILRLIFPENFSEFSQVVQNI